MREGVVMKIVYVINRLFPGGAENMTYILHKGMMSLGHDSKLLTLYGSDEQYSESVVDMGNSGHFSFTQRMKLYFYILQERPSIVHCHLSSIFHMLPIIPLARLLGVRFIYTIHNLAQHDFAINKYKKILFLCFYNLGLFKLISISPQVTQSLKDVGVKPDDEIFNGVSVELPRKEFLARDKEVLQLVCVANFKRQKRHDRLINVFYHVNKKINARLVLLGDGELREETEKKVNELMLDDKVDFYGSIPDISQIMSDSDIFVLTSDYEGHPLSVLEAMVYKLPVVATKAGGVPAIVKHCVSGFLCEDENDLVDSIIKLAENPMLRTQMGENGRKIIVEKFSEKTMNENYLSLYENTIL